MIGLLLIPKAARFEGRTSKDQHWQEETRARRVPDDRGPTGQAEHRKIVLCWVTHSHCANPKAVATHAFLHLTSLEWPKLQFDSYVE